MMQFIVRSWKLGSILALYTPKGIRAVLLGVDAPSLVETLKNTFPSAQAAPKDSPCNFLMTRFMQYADNPNLGYTDPIDLQGTDFQKLVWNYMMTIPPGVTITYAELANRIGQPKAYRAVAKACAKNSLALIIPCHRIVAQQGLGGYRWGIAQKHALLQEEKRYYQSKTFTHDRMWNFK